MYVQPLAIADRVRPPRLALRSQGKEAGFAADTQTYLILAVDDELDSIEFLRVLLEAEGYEFVAATSGAEALVLCRERKPDLAIVDIMMPGMTGFELCDLLRSDIASRGIPIIVYSAHEAKPYSNSGLYDIAFVKPAEPDDLLRAILLLLPETSTR